MNSSIGINQRKEEYLTFLRNKATLRAAAGLDVSREDLHPSLFPHQRDAVLWALARGAINPNGGIKPTARRSTKRSGWAGPSLS